MIVTAWLGSQLQAHERIPPCPSTHSVGLRLIFMPGLTSWPVSASATAGIDDDSDSVW